MSKTSYMINLSWVLQFTSISIRCLQLALACNNLFAELVSASILPVIMALPATPKDVESAAYVKALSYIRLFNTSVPPLTRPPSHRCDTNRLLYIAMLLGIWFGCSVLCSFWSHLYLHDSSNNNMNMLVSILTLVQVAASAGGQFFWCDGKRISLSVGCSRGKLIGTFHFITSYCMNACMASSGIACANSIRVRLPSSDRQS